MSTQTKSKQSELDRKKMAREMRAYAKRLVRAADILDPPKLRAGRSRKDK